MSLDLYLVQYIPDLRRQERFNVGLYVKINDDVEARFLSDGQWQARFGDTGSFNNWKAWRRYYDRTLENGGIEGLLDSQERGLRAAPSSYLLIHAGQRIYGEDPEDIVAHADETFEELVM